METKFSKPIIPPKKLKQMFWFEVCEFYSEMGEYDVIRIQPFQIRMQSHELEIDVFPKSHKFFNITTQTWGIIRNGDIAAFIRQQFEVVE